MLETSARLLRLLSLLQARRVWTGPELADRLKVTTRTVRRDVDRLRLLGYPVDAVPGPAGGYQLGIGTDLPPLLLDDDEAVAVALALRTAVDASAVDVGDAALAALAKISQTLPDRLRARIEGLGDVTLSLYGTNSPHGADATISSDLLVTLAQGCRWQERVRCSYVDRLGNHTDRRIEPYRLVRVGRRWYLVAHDLDREAWRTFRVDRIGTAELAGHRFEFTDPPDAVALVEAALSSAPAPHEVRIRIDEPAEAVRARLPRNAAKVEPIDEGRCEVTAGGDRLDVVVLWLAMLDLDFTVVEPPEAAAELERLAARFQRAAGAA